MEQFNKSESEPKTKDEHNRLIREKIFLDKANKKHSNKYDYSKMEYIDTNTKICIICPKHGEFWQSPRSHISSNGCPECSKEEKIEQSKLTLNDFITRSKQVHDIEYDYSEVKYINSSTKVSIICPIHGKFWQSPSKHLAGHDCPECSKTKCVKNRHSDEKFLLKCKEKWGDYYDFSKVVYVDCKTPVTITCPIHGDFKIKPDNFIYSKYGCQKCAKNYRYTLAEWIETANKIHNNKYDYSLIDKYINAHQMMSIICPKHGVFKQVANSHIINKCGCPKCALKMNQNKLYDKLCLDFPGITILNEVSVEWLKPQRFDIYFPDYNIAIEYQGQQHYYPVSIFGGVEGFTKQQERDNKKRNKCIENKCVLFEFKYDYDEEFYNSIKSTIFNIIDNKLKLL